MKNKSTVFRLLLIVLTLSAWKPLAAEGEGAGFYTGFVYRGDAQTPRSRVELVNITVSSHGIFRSSIGLNGFMSPGSGVIQFTEAPSPFPFTTGVLTNGTITASRLIVDQTTGRNTTLDLEASATAPELTNTASLYGRLNVVSPRGGVRGMNRVRFAEDEFLAVGPTGSFAHSDDGIHWFRAGLPTTTEIFDVMKVDGTYVAVGFDGSAYVSTNIQTWMGVEISTNSVTAIEFGNGVWVSVDYGGHTFTSPNGRDWIAGPAPIPQFINPPRPLLGPNRSPKLEFLNGSFLLWATDFVSFSHDGKTWSEPVNVKLSAPTAGSPIAYGNGRYVLVNTTGISHSTNGTAWTFQTPPQVNIFPPLRFQPAAIAFVDGRFLALSRSASGTIDVFSSEDGADWTLLRRGAVGAAEWAYGNGRWVAIGNKTWVSDNGTRWQLSEMDPFTERSSQPLVIRRGVETVQIRSSHFREALYANVPAEGPLDEAHVNTFSEIGPLSIWAGNDGYIYYHQQLAAGPAFGVAPPLTHRDLVASASSPELGFIVGQKGTIIRAEPGTTGPVFTLQSQIVTNDLHAASYRPPAGTFPGAFVFGGQDGCIIYTLGPEYRTFQIAAAPTTRTVRVIDAPFSFGSTNSAYFLAAGDKGTMLYSTDAAHWTRIDLGTDRDIVALVHAFNLFQAFSDEAVFESSNGLVWTRVPDAHVSRSSVGPTREGGHFQGAAFGNGVWVFAAHGYLGATRDFHQWSYLRKNANYQDVAFGNNLFVAVGFNGRIDTSSDGAVWTNRRTPGGFRTLPSPPPVQSGTATARDAALRAVVYGDGKFVVVGDLGVILTSPDGMTWTEASSGLGAHITDIAYLNGTFVAVSGNSGLVSKDGGATWTSTSLGIVADEVAAANGRFAAVRNGAVVVSTDGLQWTARGSSPGDPNFARPDHIVGSNDRFYALAHGYIYESMNALDWAVIRSGLQNPQSGDIAGAAMAVGNGLLVIAEATEISTVGLHDDRSPVFTQQPTSTSVSGTMPLTLHASGIEGSSYQWFHNGSLVVDSTRISGAQTATLVVNDTARRDSGTYTVAISNAGGSRLSDSAVVSIVPGPEQNLSQWLRFNGLNSASDDADNDRVANAVEYALASDPLEIDDSPATGPSLSGVTPGVGPGVYFVRKKGLNGARVRVTATASLNSPAAVETVQEVQSVSVDAERVTIRALNPPTGNVFFHIIVQQE